MPSVNRSWKSARASARKSPRANKLHARRCLVESLEERTVLASTISGFAYVDSNNDGARGASEMGVPGVQITLTGNNVTRTVLTNNSGAYSFTNLADGTYSLAELQPNALADGVDSSGASGATTGNDQFSNITVSGTQTVANMNFGERGVKPQFAGIQCFFASAETQDACFREIVATGEERAGNNELAAAIRAGDTTVNRAPVANNNTYSATGGQTLTVTAANGVLTNDTDADGNALTAALVSNVTNGTLALNANGSFTYTPNASFSGTDTFTYRANDGTANSNNATVTITVAANAAPVANNDTFTATEDTTLSIAAAGVLSNDTDANGNPLTAAIVTQAANGTVTLNADGSFNYVPNANFAGTDTFTYRANDGFTNSANATVTINVTAVNDAPVATNDAYDVTSGVAFTTTAANGVRANDNDVENDALTVALVDNVSNGTLILNADGSFTYTSTAGFTGAVTFTYRVNDGTTNSNTATVTLNVAANAAPVANNDNYTIVEDGTLTVPVATGVLANDTDANSNALTATVVTTTANGTLTLNADGSFTYVPNPNFNGTDTFTYKANDGQADSANATVTITVSAVNDTPVANNDSYSTGEDVTLTVPVATGVLLNDTDADTDATLTATVLATTTHGELTLNGDGSFTYVPAANFNGTDTFTYTVSDGTATSAAATVTITVTAAADAPVAANDTFTMAEDGTLTVPVATGVLANDTDAEGNPLTATLVQDVANGTLTFNADGSFTYVPNANFNGTDTFTYRANDGTADSNIATVTITISAVNDAPVAVADSYETAINAPLVIALPGVLTNDTDVEGDELTAVLGVGPEHGTLTLNPDGSFTYTPDTGFQGTDSFTYRANDGTADSNLGTVTIMVNTAPVAVDDAYNTDEDTTLTVPAAGVLINDTDANTDALTAVLVAGPANGTLTLNSDGSFTYAPDANFNGTDTFTYRANDGLANSNVATVTITIAAINDAPVAVADAYTTEEGQTLTVPAAGVLVNDTDVDGDPLTAVLVTDAANGSLTLNADGSFTYAPDSGFSGADTFTYHANDGTANSADVTVTITVAPNVPPVAVLDNYETDEDATLTVTAANGVLANDTDVNANQTLTAILVAGPATGTLNLAADGSFTYAPAANASGPITFTYKANDGLADSNEVTVTIDVAAVNDPPVGEAKNYDATEDTQLVIDAANGLLQNATDVEGEPLTAALTGTPVGGTPVVAADGSFTFTPAENFSGAASFQYVINDGTDNSVAYTVTINVAGANDAPVAVSDTYQTATDVELVIAAPGVLMNDTDADGDSLTATLVALSGPANGTLTLSADGSFSYLPDSGFRGTDSFSYVVNDGTTDSAPATVTITVNTAPVAQNDAYNATAGTPLTITAPGVLTNDTDANNDSLTAVLVDQATNGNVVLAADGSFVYTPDAGFTGDDTFTYRANDGLADSALATVTITVAPVNLAPVAVDDTYNTDEDTPLVVPVGTGASSNDTDAENNTLTATVVAGPTSGDLTLNGDGSFTYTPNANFNGSDSFTYKVNDGTNDSNVAMVTITIAAVNDPPVAANTTFTGTEDTSLSIDAADGVLSNASDEESDPLTAAVVANSAVGGSVVLSADGSFTFTPATNFTGAASFQYVLNDGTDDSAIYTATINVAAENDAPTGTNDSYNTAEETLLTIAAPGVLTNDTDVDGDSITVTLVATTTSGSLTLDPDGSFTYLPNQNFFGADTFTYQVSDGPTTSSTVTVTIQVTNVNDAPVAAAQSYSTPQDTTLTEGVPGLLAGATDNDGGDILTALKLTDPTNGTVTVAADGSFTYVPDAGFAGEDSFTYAINDGTVDSAPATVTITVVAQQTEPQGEAPFEDLFDAVFGAEDEWLL